VTVMKLGLDLAELGMGSDNTLNGSKVMLILLHLLHCTLDFN
jgi:hypothetical protein